MAGFSADWLALREPADTLARSPGLRRQVADWCTGRDPVRIVDLGAGTGAGLRWLAPALRGEQYWRLLDHDPALLAALPRRLRDWAATQGLGWLEDGTNLVLSDSGRVLSVGPARVDLARGLDAVDWHGTDLVSASALLDLVSAEWLDRLAGHCRRHRTALYCTLSYDGRLSWAPELVDDARMGTLFNHHQRSDKGFGPALGPAAADYCAQRLTALGYRVRTADSPWRLDRTAVALQQALLSGYQAVAAALEPDAGWPTDWLERRRTLLDRPGAEHRVGHVDLFAWLP